MKLSETKAEALSSLTDEQLARLIYGGIQDTGTQADVALLLGTSPKICRERAEQAAALYQAGRVRYIMPTGGVAWDYEGDRITEAEFMRQVLLNQGVPDEAILLENEARTTKENMLYGAIQINRLLKLQNVRTVCIVTSANHMRRSLALASWLLPRSLQISGSPANFPADPVHALRTSTALRDTALREVELMKGLIDCGVIEDLEYSS